MQHSKAIINHSSSANIMIYYVQNVFQVVGSMVLQPNIHESLVLLLESPTLLLDFVKQMLTQCNIKIMVLYIANNISAQLHVNFIVLLFTHQSVSVEQFFKAPSVMQPAKYDICKALITVSMRIALQLKLWGRVGLHISL